MTNRDEPFQPESVEEQLNQLLAQAASRPTEPVGPETRLVQDLRRVHTDDLQSGERVWARLAERLGERNATPDHLHMLPNHPFPMERRTSMHTPELNTMQSQVTEPPRSPRRVFALVAAALVVMMLVGSAMWLFTAIHMLQQNNTTAQGGGIRAGKLLCSTSYSTDTRMEQVQPPLGWSASGVIATANPSLKIFSGQTCASQSLITLPNTLVRPVWSPDGTRLLLLAGDTAKVLDATTGGVLASFQADRSTEFAQAVWASNGTQIISSEVNVLSHTTQRVNIQVWNANSGALIRTALTFHGGILIGSAWISPNGQYLALQRSDHKITFWNIGTEKVVSTTTSSVAGNSQPVTWSPYGASLAVGLPNANWPEKSSEVQIWSSATGQPTATLQDPNTFEGNIDGLAWSPNGTYLAESSAEIHIWNIATGRLVATFGKIATKTTSSNGKATTVSQIVSVSWASDGRKLASVTTSVTNPPVPGSNQQNIILNVWQLS